ncbi:OmpA family protein [Vibrio astriarenae]
MMDKPIVIKKKSTRRARTLQHGGWKVAMADLMISLMCLFLVLWILQVVDGDDQKKLLNYFAYGNNPVMKKGLTEDGGSSINPLPLPHIPTSHYDSELLRINESSLLEGEFNSQQELEVLAKTIQKQLHQNDAISSVEVYITPQGLKMVIIDSENGAMFYRGSAKVTPFYQDLLLSLGVLLNGIENKMIVTGHTDASRYRGSEMTNWELSSARANRARYYLDQGGLEDRHIFQVTGMSDTAPISIEDPSSGQNRRIELYILTRDAHDILSRVYKEFSSEPLPSERYQTKEQLNQTLPEYKHKARNDAKVNQAVTVFEVMQRYD